MKNYCLLLLSICTSIFAQAQMTASFDKSLNTQCDGVDCYYSELSIMINEIMVSPILNDGSISGNSANDRGEWIELYNPNTCESVDISCYYLGSSAPQVGYVGGQAFQMPSNVIIPPGGFCVVRGVNAIPVPSNLLVANGGNTVEIIVPAKLDGDGICMEGPHATRLWFPNAEGWFAFYDDDGVAQDALSWGTDSWDAGDGPDIAPCVPEHSTCNGGSVTSLQSFNDIPANRKEKVYNMEIPKTGNSIQRIPDGGPWHINQGVPPTLGDCNDICAQTSSSTCDGEATINVTAGSGNYSYVWDDSQGQLTQTAIELCAGTYTVTVTDKDTGNKQTFTVEIEDLEPDVKLVINEEPCNYGQTVSMDDVATYSPKPTADQSGIFSGTGASGSNFDVSISEAGTFPITYTFTDENECTNSAIDDITVHEIPQAQISNIEPEYCMDNSIIEPILSPLGGVLSGPGVSNNQFVLEDAGIGTHIIKYAIENQYGCKDTTQITVTIHANPTFTIDITEPNCDQADGEIIINPNVGVGASPYNYSIDGEANTQTNNTFSNLSAGPYDILVTDNNGCVAMMDTILINKNSDPSFTFADFCEGESNGATNIVTPAGEFSFNLPTNDGATIDLITGVISNGVGGTTYTVQHATTDNCPDTTTTDVTVYPLPEPQFVGDILDGCEPHTVNFTNLGNSTGGTCLWSFGDGNTSTLCDNVTHIYQSSGTYSISLDITDANGCFGTHTKYNYIEVIPRPVVSFTADPMVTETKDPLITFTNNSYDATGFTWSFGDDSPDEHSFHTTHTYPKGEVSDYIVTLIASNGPDCDDTARVVIKVKEELIFYVPNSFTPDGNSFNETFQPVFSSGYDPQNYTLLIYNRWGELIFESHNTDIGWDGRYGESNSKAAKDGTYVWKIKVKEKQNNKHNVYVGHVTLMR